MISDPLVSKRVRFAANKSKISHSALIAQVKIRSTQRLGGREGGREGGRDGGKGEGER